MDSEKIKEQIEFHGLDGLAAETFETVHSIDLKAGEIVLEFPNDVDHAYLQALGELVGKSLITVRGSLRIELPKTDYEVYLASPEWKAKSIAAKERAGNRCQLCNSRGPLDTHHRTYERLGNELSEDLIALCRKCHSKFHGKPAR